MGCYIILIMATVYKVDVLFWFHYLRGSLVKLKICTSVAPPCSFVQAESLSNIRAPAQMQSGAANIWRLILNTESVITEAISQMKDCAMSILFDYDQLGMSLVKVIFNNLIPHPDIQQKTPNKNSMGYVSIFYNA